MLTRKKSIIDKYTHSLPAKHAALRIKNTDWVARNQENVFEWDDMYIRGLLCYINRTKRVVLVQSGPNYHLIEN